MSSLSRPGVYLASPVFQMMAENPLVSRTWKIRLTDQFSRLEKIADLTQSPDRFPEPAHIASIVRERSIAFIGCHLSHQLDEMILSAPSLMGVCTATAGYNHIPQFPGIIITHTPSVLQKAVAEFTLSLILSSLKQIPALHSRVWNLGWKPGERWDMDTSLGTSLGSLTLGIVGLGEIARELVRLLEAWNMTLLYHSRSRNLAFELAHPNLKYVPDPDTVFEQSDIVSLHVPLTQETRFLVNEHRLGLMKPGALLVNTARGDIIDFPCLLDLLESGRIRINLAFDVYAREPIPASTLERFHTVIRNRPDLNFVFLPHTASADADTRAAMTSMMLDDLMGLIQACHPDDLKGLHLIPEQKNILSDPESFKTRLFSKSR